MARLLYGVAYYHEYLPTDRLHQDVEMMTAAGINVVRIAESTWSTLEPRPGHFDFHHVDVVLDAMATAGISVIVGTPTYAVPAWLVAAHPEVLADTPGGEAHYGARQLMDIVNPAFRLHAERVIRELASHTAAHPAVIGFQIDNETKYYDAVSSDVQRGFVRYLRERFDGDLSTLNRTFGLDYWSNRIDAWEDFPDLTGTINGSLGSAFDRYRRGLVEEYLGWQTALVREYAREDQFVTQNFDFDWAPGWSYGMQPSVDHFRAAETVDVAGVDIYHPTQDRLTGKEIAFGGDLMRSVKGGANYLVLETQAQGQLAWLPYPGQLRLQAYSHLASGALGVMYWHWHSIHNSFESYWKGLLSHDFQPNPTYDEATTIGAEFARHSARLEGLQKTNRVAVMVSNEALTALRWFTIETGFIDGPWAQSIGYNDVLRWVYDALFDLNIEVDFVSPDDTELGRYDVLIVPALYSAPQATITRLRDFAVGGGHLVATFKTAVANEDVTIWNDAQPHGLTEVFGLGYNQFTKPEGVELALRRPLEAADGTEAGAAHFMELLTPTTAQPLAEYVHPHWGRYAAITRNTYGRGTATYLGTMTSPQLLREVLTFAVREAGLWQWPQDLAGQVSVRRGVNAAGESVVFLLNYTGTEVTIPAPAAGSRILDASDIAVGDPLAIEPWGVEIIVG